jgi:hypothetical protein
LKAGACLSRTCARAPQESLRGLAELTQLVEAAQGDGAARLAEDIRSTSTVELLVALLDDKEAAVNKKRHARSRTATRQRVARHG